MMACPRYDGSVHKLVRVSAAVVKRTGRGRPRSCFTVSAPQLPTPSEWTSGLGSAKPTAQRRSQGDLDVAVGTGIVVARRTTTCNTSPRSRVSVTDQALS